MALKRLIRERHEWFYMTGDIGTNLSW